MRRTPALAVDDVLTRRRRGRWAVATTVGVTGAVMLFARARNAILVGRQRVDDPTTPSPTPRTTTTTATTTTTVDDAFQDVAPPPLLSVTPLSSSEPASSEPPPFTLPPPSFTLPPPSFTLPPPSFTLPPPSFAAPPPSSAAPPSFLTGPAAASPAFVPSLHVGADAPPMTADGRSYLYDAFPQRARSHQGAATPATKRTHPAARPLRAGARLVLVAATLVAAIVIPLSESAPQGDATASMWPTQRLSGTYTLTTPGATVGTGVQLSAATTALAAAHGVSTFGGGALTSIPAPVLAAYQQAAVFVDNQDITCNLTWSMLAAIGEIESQHAIGAGALKPGWNGVASPPIIGPVLDGRAGRARISDTDHGRLDGDTHFDRAVGPMQFLPSTWATWGTDGNGDGIANPQQINDATVTAGLYLCHGGVDLSDPLALAGAIASYNHADWYVRAVLAASAGYLAESYGRSEEASAQAAIAFAFARLGDPYLFGGTGPLYDCSGLTQAAFASIGITIPRTAEQQWQLLPHVDVATLQPGDLVFFNPGEFVAGLPGHVGIYLGHGDMVDDPHTGAFVRIEPIAGFGTFVGAARPALLTPASGSNAPGASLVINVAPPKGSATVPTPAASPSAAPTQSTGSSPHAPSTTPTTGSPAPVGTPLPTTPDESSSPGSPTPAPSSSVGADQLRDATQAHRSGGLP